MSADRRVDVALGEDRRVDGARRSCPRWIRASSFRIRSESVQRASAARAVLVRDSSRGQREKESERRAHIDALPRCAADILD